MITDKITRRDSTKSTCSDNYKTWVLSEAPSDIGKTLYQTTNSVYGNKGRPPSPNIALKKSFGVRLN